MGFPVEACKKAIFFTKNSGLEAATQWMMEHMADNDFGDPFIPPGTETSNKQSNFVPNPEGVMMLISMGFTEQQAAKALKETDNNTERAVDWIFSHQDELNSGDGPGEPMDQSPAAAEVSQYRDGNASEFSSLFLENNFLKISSFFSQNMSWLLSFHTWAPHQQSDTTCVTF